MDQPCYCGRVSLDPDHCANVREGVPVCRECVDHLDALLAARARPRPIPRRRDSYLIDRGLPPVKSTETERAGQSRAFAKI